MSGRSWGKAFAVVIALAEHVCALTGPSITAGTSRSLKSSSLCLSSSPTTGSANIAVCNDRDTWDREEWLNGWSTVQTEDQYALEGDFPADLHGTFFQNGHAKFHVGERDLVMHPFDGDGMVKAVTFKNGKAWFRNRFVQTPGYKEELAKGKICYRGLFGTAKGGGAWYRNIFDVRLKNVANTNVVYANNRLFALWEGGKPFELNPATLETIGESDMDGTLATDDNYSAHYKLDPSTGNLCNFSILQGASSDPNESHTVLVLEHDPKTLELLYKRRVTIPGFGLAHDCAITNDYFVLFQAATKIDPLPFVLGRKGVAQCIAMDDSGTCQLHLIPRGADHDESETISIDLPTCFSFHVANAFQEQDDIVVVDVVLADRVLMSNPVETPGRRPEWETVDFAKDHPSYALTRVRVDVVKKKVLSMTSMTGEGSKNIDFPALHPDKVGSSYQYAYCVAGASTSTVQPHHGLLKVDVEKGRVLEKWLPDHDYEFMSEPVFVPRDGLAEDDGYLVGYLMNGRDKTTHIVVFDAQLIVKGPVAKAPLRDFMPHSLHGAFVKDYVPSMAE